MPGITTFRVSTKDRTFVDEVHYKGWSIRLADWLHLSNPDDPSRPIVGHVFKCWISDEPWVSCCLFLRPLRCHVFHFLCSRSVFTLLVADRVELVERKRDNLVYRFVGITDRSR